jgi:ABC-type uncharacterized transport system substrate-binding protein
LFVRLTLSDSLAAWQILLAQVAACTVAYVATLALVDHPVLSEVVRLASGRTKPKSRA